MKGLEPVHISRRSYSVLMRFAGGVCGVHHAAHAVHLGDLPAGVQGDVVVGVPVPGVEHDLVQRLLAGQHRRQQDAVVVGVGLGAEDRDVVQVGGDLQQLFERAHAGHAVADHHQFHLLHGVSPLCAQSVRAMTARMSPCTPTGRKAVWPCSWGTPLRYTCADQAGVQGLPVLCGGTRLWPSSEKPKLCARCEFIASGSHTSMRCARGVARALSRVST